MRSVQRHFRSRNPKAHQECTLCNLHISGVHIIHILLFLRPHKVARISRAERDPHSISLNRYRCVSESVLDLELHVMRSRMLRVCHDQWDTANNSAITRYIVYIILFYFLRLSIRLYARGNAGLRLQLDTK